MNMDHLNNNSDNSLSPESAFKSNRLSISELYGTWRAFLPDTVLDGSEWAFRTRIGHYIFSFTTYAQISVCFRVIASQVRRVQTIGLIGNGMRRYKGEIWLKSREW